MKSKRYFVVIFAFLFSAGAVYAYAPRSTQQREMMYKMFAPFDSVNANPIPSKKITEKVQQSEPQKVVTTKPTINKPITAKLITEKPKPARKTSIKKKKKLKAASQKVYNLMEALTPEKKSALEERLESENLVSKAPFGISFYKPTYILPSYYTSSPYGAIYRGTTPDNQQVKSLEFKAQLSIKFPLVRHLWGKHSSINLGYTQLSYWQFYAKSQYFRETDYEPALFWSDRLVRNWWFNLGAMHQSNGRGGKLERSWNRVFGDLMISGSHWMIDLNPWLLVFQSDSSDLHNPDIADYMGHGQTTFSYKIHRNVFSLMLRNNVESWFKRGAIEFDYSFPIYGHLSGYAQFFSGYGQSLIEYNHSTTAYGIGIALSNWI